MKYDPEIWLESTVRVLKEFSESEFDNAIKGSSGEPIGLAAYEIVMEFPGTDLDDRKVPMRRTVIHFEIDDIVSRVVGMGENVFAYNYDPIAETIKPQEAIEHQINFDVGVWSTDASGGTTARLRAKQILMHAFGGAGGITKLREWSDGGDGCLEILNFSGGRFILDRINDVGCYRMVECTLELRVFSRTPMTDVDGVPTIEEILQDPHLFIEDGGNLIELG